MNGLPELLKPKQVCEWMGWSPFTLWNYVRQGKFPCYRLTASDVRYKAEDILFWIEGCKRGNFDGIPVPRIKPCKK